GRRAGGCRTWPKRRPLRRHQRTDHRSKYACHQPKGSLGSQASAVGAMMAPRRILILGGGFGGIYAALELEKILARRDALEVTVATRDTFFPFTPMLHEVAAGDLELNTIVNPLRKLLRRVNTFIGNVEAIDLEARQVQVSHGLDGHTHDLPYD